MRALELRLLGKTYEQIGDELGIKKVSAWHLVQDALNDEERKISEDTEKVRALEIRKLLKIEDEAWAAWARGIGKKQKTTQEKTTGGRDGGGTKASIVTEDLNGDPRYLAVILDCQQRRAKLLGLDAATKTEHSGPGGGAIEITDLERAGKIEALLSKAMERIGQEKAE